MKRTGTVVRAALAPTLFALGGCNLGPFGGSARLIDRQQDQPWDSPQEHATLDMYTEWDFVHSRDRVDWCGPGGLRVRVYDIEQTCEKFSPRAEPEILGERIHRPRTPVIYPTTRVIVCVHPLVVLEVPVPERCRDEMGGLDASDSTAYVKIGHATLRLAYGYLYGTSAPFHDDVLWYSPDLEIPLSRPSESGEGLRRIDLPDGVLVLQRRGDLWMTEYLPKDK